MRSNGPDLSVFATENQENMEILRGIPPKRIIFMLETAYKRLLDIWKRKIGKHGAEGWEGGMMQKPLYLLMSTIRSRILATNKGGSFSTPRGGYFSEKGVFYAYFFRF